MKTHISYKQKEVLYQVIAAIKDAKTWTMNPMPWGYYSDVVSIALEEAFPTVDGWELFEAIKGYMQRL